MIRTMVLLLSLIFAVVSATCAQIISIILLTLGTTQAAPSGSEDLWSNPCSNHPVRHIRSTAEKELKFFIRILRKDIFNDLAALYNKDLKNIKGNCPKLQRLIGSVKRAPNITMAHQSFYKSMIEFAVYLDQLKEISIKTNQQFNFEKRDKIYEKTQNALRLTICEFHETIRKEYNNPNIFLKKPPAVSTKCLPKEVDSSRVQMLDMQFFMKLRRFFKQGRKTLKQKKMISKSGKKKRGNKRRTKS